MIYGYNLHLKIKYDINLIYSPLFSHVFIQFHHLVDLATILNVMV